jgi:3-dehydroquinate dehydratase-1
MTIRSTPRLVGVIFSLAALRCAVGMRRPPDLFELRLDAMFAKIEAVERVIKRLRAPLIITARHPCEGGLNQLPARKRCALLLRFLPDAAYVDIELRSAGALAPVFEEARAKSIRTIISFHDLNGTPSQTRLDEIARAAWLLNADILKIATRTDTPAQLARLHDFFQRQRLKNRIAAMGIGDLGRISRFELAKQGSTLNYARLGRSQIEGQPSIGQLRRALR